MVNPVDGRRAASRTRRRASATPTSAAATLAFPDRYRASAEWERARAGTVAADGGWRIYSSGPGLYTGILLCHALGLRRWFGERVVAPVLPKGFGPVTLEREMDGRSQRLDLSAG